MNPKTPINRCAWCGDDALYQDYHDNEWGRPCYDERTLFEFILLEGAQAGLSWITILRRREGYREAFANYDLGKIANFDDKKVAEIKQQGKVIRHEGKIRSAVGNAQAAIKLCEEYDSLANYFWGFVDGTPIQGNRKSLKDVPVETELSSQISKDMKKRGFKFFGPTICYAYMQAIGLVNDHLIDCFVHDDCKNLGKKISR